eukprot:tig00000093_g3572.t1
MAGGSKKRGKTTSPAAPANRKRQRGAPAAAAELVPAAGNASAPAVQQPNLSALELLPDDLLNRVFGFLGLREVWDVCRLPLVSRRMRDALRSEEVSALVLRGSRLGLSRYRDVREAELRSWARRLKSGAMRLAAGGALEIDLLRSQRCVESAGATDDSRIQFSFWAPSPTRPFLSFVSCIQGLRRFVAWHGDVAPSSSTANEAAQTTARHTYVGALLKALAPAAGTLEELSIRLQTERVIDRRRLPDGAPRKAIVAGLKRLTALRSLDLADCVGFSGKLLEEVGPALGGLRSLRIAHRDVDPYPRGPHEFGERLAAPQEAFACAIEKTCPLLEELRVVLHMLVNHWMQPVAPAALAALCRLPRLRTFAIKTNIWALPEFASRSLETLEVDALYDDERSTANLLRDIAGIESLRHLTLRGNFTGWPNLASAKQLRSLSLRLPRDNYVYHTDYALPREALGALRSLTSLERLSVHVAGDLAETLAGTLSRLAAVLPALPALRSLRLDVTVAEPLGPALAAASAAAAAALIRAAKGTLEEYHRDEVEPALAECAALAACTRLRRASLTLAGAAAAAASGALAALAPLAAMAARPAPAPGDLVLARQIHDRSDWGAIRPLLGPRWALA